MSEVIGEKAGRCSARCSRRRRSDVTEAEVAAEVVRVDAVRRRSGELWEAEEYPIS